MNEPKSLTCTVSRFPKNCSTGRIWLLSSSGKMLLPISSQSMSSGSCLSEVSLASHPCRSSSSLSSFSLPSGPRGSGDAEHLVLLAWWHSQVMWERLSRPSSALPSPLSPDVCLFGLLTHLLPVAQTCPHKVDRQPQLRTLRIQKKAHVTNTNLSGVSDLAVALSFSGLQAAGLATHLQSSTRLTVLV